jgi:hypothetical protein
MDRSSPPLLVYDPDTRRDVYDDDPLWGVGRDVLRYSGSTIASWVHRWMELPPYKRPSGGEWKFLRDYRIWPMGATDLGPAYVVEDPKKFNETRARNCEALARWYRAGACDTCITDLDFSVGVPMFL